MCIFSFLFHTTQTTFSTPISYELYKKRIRSSSIKNAMCINSTAEYIMF